MINEYYKIYSLYDDDDDIIINTNVLWITNKNKIVEIMT